MAESNYKQVRLTLTEERSRTAPGMVNLTLRVMVKPVQAQWNERHTVIAMRHPDQPALADMTAVYRAIIDFLRQDSLPGSLE